jgi:hypothetical protein
MQIFSLRKSCISLFSLTWCVLREYRRARRDVPQALAYSGHLHVTALGAFQVASIGALDSLFLVVVLALVLLGFPRNPLSERTLKLPRDGVLHARLGVCPLATHVPPNDVPALFAGQGLLHSRLLPVLVQRVESAALIADHIYWIGIFDFSCHRSALGGFGFYLSPMYFHDSGLLRSIWKLHFRSSLGLLNTLQAA